jgi:mono/diheme cytochrome c family protein
VLLALTGYEAGLLVVAASFIIFALVMSLVVPRSRPGFPGGRLDVFLIVCGVFFVAQLTAVLLLAEVGEADKSARESAGEATPPPTRPPPTQSGTTTTATTTTATTTTQTGTTPAPAGQGDAAAGKAVFTGAAGCSSCHTLADAGATGNVGPNLNDLKPTYDQVVTQVTNGGGAMPAFKDTLSEKQIQDVSAYVSSVAGG